MVLSIVILKLEFDEPLAISARCLQQATYQHNGHDHARETTRKYGS